MPSLHCPPARSLGYCYIKEKDYPKALQVGRDSRASRHSLD